MDRISLIISLNFFRAIELQMSVIKKPQSLVKALRKYRKEKAYFDITNVFVTSLDKSKIMTVTHGDCWSNNFFLSSDNSEVFTTFYSNGNLVKYFLCLDFWIMIFFTILPEIYLTKKSWQFFFKIDYTYVQ